MKLLTILALLSLALCISSAVAAPADPFAPKGKPKGHYDKKGDWHTGDCGLVYVLTLGNCPLGTDIDNSKKPEGVE